MAAEHELTKLKVFVSYSRADTRFADELVAGLEYDGGFDILIDRHSIEKGEDWRARLGALIEAADTIVFVLSPASADSDICRWEVSRAAELNKRIIPVLHQPLGDIPPPSALGKFNYVDFTATPTLIAGIRDLAKALKTDLVWLREGTRLLALALDWERAGRRDNRLLSGPDIVEAKHWLANCPKPEQPTELHRDFIRSSEAAEVARLDAERTRLAELAEAQEAAARQARRVAGRTFAGLAVALVLAAVAGGAGWWAWEQSQVARGEAVRAETEAKRAAAEAERAQRSEKAAEATAREAQITQSQLLSEAARALVDQPGDNSASAPLAMLLALEGTPDPESDDTRRRHRPPVLEAQVQLERAYFANHERAVVAHGASVTAVAWSPDGRLLAIRSSNNMARIMEAATGKEVSSVTHDGAITAVAWSPDGRLVATASSDQTARIIEAATGQEVAHVTHGVDVTAVAWSPDGRLLATASDDKTARIIELSTGKEMARVAHEGSVVAVAWSSNGRLVATASWDNTARIIEAATGKEVVPLPNARSAAALAWSSDRRLVAIRHWDKTVRIIEVSTGQEVARVAYAPVAQLNRVHDVSWSPDGRLLAIRSSNNMARIMEAATGKEVSSVTHDGAITAVAWSPDGRLVATASSDQTARIVEVATGKEVARVTHGDSVTAVAWSPDGRLFATGSYDNTARIIEVATGKEVARVTDVGGVDAVAWSPDGRLLATGSYDSTARIIEVATGKEVARVTYEGGVHAVAWGPDGRFVATAPHDKTVRMVEAATGKEVAVPRAAHEGVVFAVAWSPDGRLLATGSSDNKVRIIEAATGKEVAGVALKRSVTEVAWSPENSADGPTLLTGEADETARLWRVFLSPGALVKSAKARAARCLTQAQRAQYFLPPAPPTWCVERRLWPYHGDEWQTWLPKQKTWLASGRQGDAPELPAAK